MEERLNNLRLTLRLEWGELARRLGMSRAMLDFVRKGQRNLSFKALVRLEEVEREAGILPARIEVRERPDEANFRSENGSIFDARAEVERLTALSRDLADGLEKLRKRLNM